MKEIPTKYDRRSFCRSIVATGAAALVFPFTAPDVRAESVASPLTQAKQDYSLRTDQSFQALQEHFFVPEHCLYIDTAQTNQRLPVPYAGNWGFITAFRGAMAYSGIREGQSELVSSMLAQGLEHYWDPSANAYNSEVAPPLGLPFGDFNHRFYDDNGHDLVALLDSGEEWAAMRAEDVFNKFIIKGVDKSSKRMPGGIPWRQTPSGTRGDRNLISNAPNALAGLVLYERTANPHYLNWANGMIEWCDRYLKDPNDGLYFDKVMENGALDQTKWSYNQGYMMAVKQKLYQLTGNPEFLGEAEQIALSSLDYYAQVQKDRFGLVNQDTDFNAIYFRYLMRLSAGSENEELQMKSHDRLHYFADHAWDNAQFQKSGALFSLPGNASPLRDQGAISEIFALAESYQ